MTSICMLITKFYPHIGGIQFQSLRVCRELVNRGIRVHVLTRNYGKLKRYELLDGIEIVRFPVYGKVRLLASVPYLILSLYWLIRHRKQYEIIYCHQAYAPATIGVLAKFILEKKVIVKVTATNDYGEMRELRRLPFFGLRMRLLSKVDKFIAITDQVGRELMAMGISGKRIAYIPNGVDVPESASFSGPARKSLRKKLGIDYEKIVMFSGRLAKEKGVETLLLAWEILNGNNPSYNLIILGNGGPVRNIEAQIRQLAARIDKNGTIHFLGWVDNVKDYLLSSDVYCLPSVSEGLSNSLLEAMASAVAVVASDIDANRFMIKDGFNGLLFESGNYRDLASKLSRVLTDSSFSNQLGIHARESVKNKCSFTKIIAEFTSLCDSLMQN